MSDKPINTDNENWLKPTGEQLDKFANLIGREPNDFELKLFVNYICCNSNKKNDVHENDTCQITDELNCVFKSESAILNSDSEFETESSKVIFRLINSILEKKAQPIAIVNSFTIGDNKTENAKAILSKVIKGTGKVSNIAGIPNLNTSIKFSGLETSHQQIHSCTIGIKNNSSSTKKTSSKKNIFLLGKLQNSTALENNKPLSTYHFKFLKDAMLELFSLDAVTTVEPIDKNGIITNIVKLARQASSGAELDISALIEENETKDYKSLFNEQPTALLVIADKMGVLLETSKKWELDCFQLGKLSSSETLIVKNKSKKIADLPLIKLLEQFPNSDEIPIFKKKENPVKKLDIKNIKLPKKPREVAWFLIKHPNIASKSCIQQQYDTMVGGASMNISFPSDAEIINIKGTNKALAVSILEKTISPERCSKLEVQISIAKLCRKMVCSGAKPLSLYANILQSNNTENIDKVGKIYEGINEITEKLKISTNLNNCNSVDGKDLLTHMAMVGLIEDKNHQMTKSFKDKGNIIFLIGSSSENLANSEYLLSYHKDSTCYLPDFRMDTERKINLAVLELISKNLICSAHNVAKGGLFLSLVESAMVFGFGFDIITDTDIRTDAFLFGENPGRVIVSVTPNKEDRFIDFMMQKELPFLAIGHVTKGEMRVDDISFGFINDAREVYDSELKKILDKPSD